MTLVLRPCGRGPLTAERLKALVRYEPDSGEFIRLQDRGGRNKMFKAGTGAGSVCPVTGYVRIRVDYRLHWAHRLAWLYMTGSWPEGEIDHRDHDRANNRWTNLRELDQAANKRNVVGCGFCWDAARKKWKANISINDRTVFLGRFDTPIDARAAYMRAKRLHHPEAVL